MPFDLHMASVGAAALSLSARREIDEFVERGKRDLNRRIDRYLASLAPGADVDDGDESAQSRLTMIRLRANLVLSRFDLYADAVTQRSEHRVGLWLSGLECLAEDALGTDGFEAPPVVCYLDRGAGAAIRRARTRLPGGELNPVALVRVPRERMIGSGVGSSLVHEVGHQGVELLEVLPSIRRVLAGFESHSPHTWSLWSRWIGEIVPDFWAVARVGPTAIMGLMSVVSVPRAFVFRVATDDPHPAPWIRVRLACAMAHELFPHRQWALLDQLWRRLYPLRDLDSERARLIGGLNGTLRALVRLIAEHRPASLRGRTLREFLVQPGSCPKDLAATFDRWRGDASAAARERPCRAIAALGQAKLCGRLSATAETRVLEHLLAAWALRRAREQTRACTRPAA